MTAKPFARTDAEILLDGKAMHPQLAQRITSVVVRQMLGAPALAEITFADPPDDARARMEAGMALAVRTGNGSTLFTGKLAGIERQYLADRGRVLKIRAHDALESLRARRRFRVLENMSPSQAWAAAAAEIGAAFEPAADGVACTSAQAGVSDLNFLVSMARSQGLHAALDGETLRLISLAGFDETIELAWGSTLLAVRVDEAGEDAVRLSRAFGWDCAGAQAFSAVAPTARQDAEIQIADFGLSLLRDDEGHLLAANQLAATEAQLQTISQDLMDRAAAAQTVANGVARGQAKVRPGVRIRLAGLGAGDPMTIVVTNAIHRFDAMEGYVTEFSSARPHREVAPAVPVITLGRVSEIADPAGGARVKVVLPAFGEIAVGYFSVVIAGAGPGKGAAALPDVGDEVVVLFPSGDLTQGLVLGGLYGASRLPRGTTTQTPRAVVLASGGDQRLVLGGARKTAILSTADGNQLSLGTNPSQLTVGGDLLIAAVGGTLTIRAQNVKFERI